MLANVSTLFNIIMTTIGFYYKQINICKFSNFNNFLDNPICKPISNLHYFYFKLLYVEGHPHEHLMMAKILNNENIHSE